MHILIYVDDILITCSRPFEIPKLLANWDTDFTLKDLGPLNFFLGVISSTEDKLKSTTNHDKDRIG
jgi:hypothetical protein